MLAVAIQVAVAPTGDLGYNPNDLETSTYPLTVYENRSHSFVLAIAAAGAAIATATGTDKIDCSIVQNYFTGMISIVLSC